MIGILLQRSTCLRECLDNMKQKTRTALGVTLIIAPFVLLVLVIIGYAVASFAIQSQLAADSTVPAYEAVDVERCDGPLCAVDTGSEVVPLGADDMSLRTTIGNGVNVVLGILGIIAIIGIFVGGLAGGIILSAGGKKKEGVEK